MFAGHVSGRWISQGDSKPQTTWNLFYTSPGNDGKGRKPQKFKRLKGKNRINKINKGSDEKREIRTKTLFKWDVFKSSGLLKKKTCLDFVCNDSFLLAKIGDPKLVIFQKIAGDGFITLFAFKLNYNLFDY